MDPSLTETVGPSCNSFLGSINTGLTFGNIRTSNWRLFRYQFSGLPRLAFITGCVNRLACAVATSSTHSSTPLETVFVKASFDSSGDQVTKVIRGLSGNPFT